MTRTATTPQRPRRRKSRATTTTTTEATTTSTTTTTTEPPTTTTTPPPVVYEGRGDQVLEISKPVPDGPAIAVIGHDGSSNFQITALDTDLERVDGMVNEIGTYQGVRPVDFVDGASSAFLEIKADGAWRIELQPVTMARRFGDAIDGVGDDVVYYEGDTGAAQVTHNGESNFQVTSYGDRREGMVNEIGPYDGSVPLRGGVFVEIVAEGVGLVVVERGVAVPGVEERVGHDQRPRLST